MAQLPSRTSKRSNSALRHAYTYSENNDRHADGHTPSTVATVTNSSDPFHLWMRAERTKKRIVRIPIASTVFPNSQPNVYPTPHKQILGQKSDFLAAILRNTWRYT